MTAAVCRTRERHWREQIPLKLIKPGAAVHLESSPVSGTRKPCPDMIRTLGKTEPEAQQSGLNSLI